ncbi:MAG: pyridoxamine 5'-phosphate oxidase family protein [Rhizobiales bacterium]|nr:pyridoxamine 5'-phosphate oxidase family protein [Hyphomicrobiales bacterium]MBI3672311.1 pyridoxamine 5'-phosphate oxidase family protein [Hyphomicrobiales bacterium]
MSDSLLYHDGNFALQEEFASRAVAARLESLARTAFSPTDKEFIESAFYFFLATADREGRPDCSFKGGAPGFVRVTAPDELAFPDYDGNGMFRSLGNLTVNPAVALIFINMHGNPRRLRILGNARVSRSDPLIAATVGAQMMVRVTARAIFPNCPRNIPKMQLVEASPFIPKWGEEPVEPAWKDAEEYRDVVHPRQKTPR